MWVDVYDTAGTTKLGDGPITTAQDWRHRPVLDGAGSFSFSMPASDPRAALLASKRLVYCYTDSASGPRLMGAGIVDSINLDTSDPSILQVSGPDLLQELATRGVNYLQVKEQGWSYLSGGHGSVRAIGAWTTGDGYRAHYDNDLAAAYDGNGATTVEVGLEYHDDLANSNYAFLYIGFDMPFDRVRITLSNPGVSGTFRLQYFNGSDWADRSYTDGTAGLAHSGEISITRPADWQRNTPTKLSGSWFWLRIVPNNVSGSLGNFWLNEVEVYADQQTKNGIAQIMAKAPAGWSIGGYSTTTGDAYLQFTDDSVLSALCKLAEATGEHFRLGEGRQIVWLRKDAPLSAIRAVQAGDAVAQESSAEIALISSLQRTQDSAELVTRVRPYGGGTGGSRVTLAATTRTPPAGYALDKTGNWLISSNAEGGGLRIEAPIQINNVMAESNSLYLSPQMAANQLFDAALSHLQQHDKPNQSYSVSVVKAAADILPGQTMHCVYQEWRDGLRTIDIDTSRDGALYVLSVERSVDDNDVYVLGLELGNMPRPSDSDVSVLVDTIGSLRDSVALGSGGGGGITVIGGTPAPASANADTVDGFHASLTPTAGALLPLDQGIKFPASTIDLAGLSGLEALQGLALADNVAGDGLQIEGKVLAVGAGTGIVVGADSVALDLGADLTWTGAHTFQGVTTTRTLVPESTDTYDLGSPTQLWRTGYLSELRSLIFAEQTIQLVGGWLVVPHDQGSLGAAVTTGATAVDFGKSMREGDFICLRAPGAVEYMQIGASALVAKDVVDDPSFEVGIGWWNDSLGASRSTEAALTGVACVRLDDSDDPNDAWLGKSDIPTSDADNWRLSFNKLEPGASLWTYHTMPAFTPSTGATRLGVRIWASLWTGQLYVRFTTDVGDEVWHSVGPMSTYVLLDEVHLVHDVPGHAVTRNLDGSGANDWPAGTAYLVLGRAGDGRIELNASTTPRISILTQGATYNAQTEVVRIGDLNGSFGVGSEQYGFAVGDYAGNNYMRYSPASGFQIHAGSGSVSLDSTGIRIDYDDDNAIRLEGAVAGHYSTIFDSHAIYGAASGLGMFSSSAYWGIIESGGAKLAMDGTGNFLKLQCRPGAAAATLALGDANNNWAMWAANNVPELQMAIGTGATPAVVAKYKRQTLSAGTAATPRVIHVGLDLPPITATVVESNVTYAFFAVGSFNLSTQARHGHCFGTTHKPTGATQNVYFTNSTAVQGTSGDVFLNVASDGYLRFHNASSATIRFTGWIFCY